MPPLKVGFVGAGFIAKFQLEAIRQIRNMEVAGVTSRTAAHAEALGRQVRDYGLGDGTVYADIGAMAPHVDAIAIYAPNYLPRRHDGRDCGRGEGGRAAQGRDLREAPGAQRAGGAASGGSGRQAG